MLAADLVPPPAVVQERLVRAKREVEVLRSQLRLSEKAVASAAEHERIYADEIAQQRETAARGVTS